MIKATAFPLPSKTQCKKLHFPLKYPSRPSQFTKLPLLRCSTPLLLRDFITYNQTPHLSSNSWCEFTLIFSIYSAPIASARWRSHRRSSDTKFRAPHLVLHRSPVSMGNFFCLNSRKKLSFWLEIDDFRFLFLALGKLLFGYDTSVTSGTFIYLMISAKMAAN